MKVYSYEENNHKQKKNGNNDAEERKNEYNSINPTGKKK